MEIEQYKKKVQAIKSKAETSRVKFNKQLDKLATDYALANNTIEIGDVIKGHAFAIRVDKIEVYKSNPPQCAYEGPRTDKNGDLSTCGREETIYQQNLEMSKVDKK